MMPSVVVETVFEDILRMIASGWPAKRTARFYKSCKKDREQAVAWLLSFLRTQRS